MPARRDAIAGALRQRVVAGLHLGTLKAGDRLPSLRQLAAETGADPRVVLAAYRQLAREGLVGLRTRSGAYVNAEAAGGDEAVLPQMAEWIVDALIAGLSHGVSPQEFRRQARRCLDTVRVKAACVECNDDQIQALCSELQDDYGFETRGVELQALDSAAGPPPAVRAADVVVTTRFHASELQRRPRRAGKPLIVVSLMPAFMAEMSRLLAAGPIYFVCTDPRFAAKLPRIFSSVDGGERIRPVVLGRDPLEAIPSGAVTYVMRGAHARVPAGVLRGTVVNAPRVFSLESARELLRFAMRANLAALGTAPRDLG